MKPMILGLALLISAPAFATTEYSCADGKYTASATEVAQLFEDVLGVKDVRPGMVLAELPGNGNRVFLRIKRASTFQLQLDHRGYKGDLPSKVCVAPGPKLIASVDASSVGYSKYTVTITNPKKLNNQIKMVGSGQLNQLINWDYQVTSSMK